MPPRTPLLTPVRSNTVRALLQLVEFPLLCELATQRLQIIDQIATRLHKSGAWSLLAIGLDAELERAGYVSLLQPHYWDGWLKETNCRSGIVAKGRRNSNVREHGMWHAIRRKYDMFRIKQATAQHVAESVVFLVERKNRGGRNA